VLTDVCNCSTTALCACTIILGRGAAELWAAVAVLHVPRLQQVLERALLSLFGFYDYEMQLRVNVEIRGHTKKKT
jgi:hypothetical protein